MERFTEEDFAGAIKIAGDISTINANGSDHYRTLAQDLLRRFVAGIKERDSLIADLEAVAAEEAPPAVVKGRK